jgi:hypothetical protein
MGVVEALVGNIKSLLRRGRGYRNFRYLLLKAQRMAVTKTEFITSKKAAVSLAFKSLAATTTPG